MSALHNENYAVSVVSALLPSSTESFACVDQRHPLWASSSCDPMVHYKKRNANEFEKIETHKHQVQTNQNLRQTFPITLDVFLPGPCFAGKLALPYVHAHRLVEDCWTPHADLAILA